MSDGRNLAILLTRSVTFGWWGMENVGNEGVAVYPAASENARFAGDVVGEAVEAAGLPGVPDE